MKTCNSSHQYRFCTQRRIAVTGMGVLTANSSNQSEFEKALRDGICCIDYLKGDVEGDKFVGSWVDEKKIEEAFLECAASLYPQAKRIFKRASKSVKGSMLVACEAWKQAELDKKLVDGSRIGVVVSGSNISNTNMYEMGTRNKDNYEYIHPRYALEFMDTCHVGAVSEMFKIHGDGFTVGGASASGNVALLRASELIQLGIVDVCIVVGAMADLSPIEINALKNLGAYGGKTKDKEAGEVCRPFDIEHDGFVLGQASGCLILEGVDSAAARDALVLATLEGGAQRLDGTSLSDPCLEGESLAMRAALVSAGINITDIDYINTHGTSTPLGDITELQSIRNVFQENTKKIWLNSTKELIGHGLFSAGIIEAVATILQMNKGFVHPFIHLDNPVDSDFRFAGKKAETCKITYSLSNAYGFAGINTSIVLKNQSN